MREYFGWTQRSDMASVYVHLSGGDVDDAILRLHGIKANSNEENDSFSSLNCMNCNAKNAPTSKICVKCGCSLIDGLKENQNQSKDDLLTILMKDSDFKELPLKKAL